MPSPSTTDDSAFELQRFSALLVWMAGHGEMGLGAREMAEVLWLTQLLPNDGAADEPPLASDQQQPELPPPPDLETPEPAPERTEEASTPVEDQAPSSPAQSGGSAALLPREALPTMEDLPEVMPVWLEDPPLLGQPLDYLRAIAPLITQKADSGRLGVDEEETVERYGRDLFSRSGRRYPLITPVWRALPEPRFDLVLAVDGGVSMQLWERLLPEMRRLFGTGGAFRDLRILQLCDADGQLRPLSQLNPVQREGRQLLLLLSDCVGKHWWSGAIHPLLEQWADRLPFAVLQVLPRRMWERTALGQGAALTLANIVPAAPTSRYLGRALRRPLRGRRSSDEDRSADPGALVPVLSCDPDSLQSWSAVVMGDPRLRIAGFRLTRPQTLGITPMPSEAAPPDSLQQWQRFRELASPQGRELARLLAAAPVLTLPVMRLVKQALMAGDQTPLAMAEVLLGGLLQVIPSQEGQHQADRAFELQFDFRSGLRDQLLAESNSADTLAVMNAVSKLVEQRWNRFAPEQSFRAFLQDPRALAPENLEGLQSFGMVMADIVERLGGRYETFAQQLRHGATKVATDDPALCGPKDLPEGEAPWGGLPGLVLLSWAGDPESAPVIEELSRTLENLGIQVLRSYSEANADTSENRDQADLAIQRALLLLAVITPAYLHSHRCMLEELMPAFQRWPGEQGEWEKHSVVVVADEALPMLLGDARKALLSHWQEQLARKRPTRKAPRRKGQEGQTDPNESNDISAFLADLPLLLRMLSAPQMRISLSAGADNDYVSISQGVRVRLEAIEAQQIPIISADDTPSTSGLSYQVGGSLPEISASYVERVADKELYKHLNAGDYCFVFSTRQMGKSSLRVRAMQKLRAEGVICAVIDPQRRGTTLNEAQWYAGTIKLLLADVGLAEAVNFSQWWKEQDAQSLSSVERFYEFIDQILLARTTQKIVIFVEEVDNLLSLSFDTDGFFGLIRSLYEKRGENLAFQRLTFCFLGVATPYDLIRSHHRSPFNIGHPVEMAGFKHDEALPLLVGLKGRVQEPEAVLRAVLHWSGGQPFLTQKLLKLVAETAKPDTENIRAEALVEQVVRRNVIENWEGQDVPPHLKTIRDRVSQSDEKGRAVLLQLYQRILDAGHLPADSSWEQLQLRLTGLVVPKQGTRLEIYNPIYAEVFNAAWVQQQLADLHSPQYGVALAAWKKAENSRKPEFLLQGDVLEEAETWASGKRLSEDDQAFLDASRKAERARVKELERKLADIQGEHQLNPVKNLTGVRLYIVYSDKDTRFFKQLEDQLVTLQKQGILEAWQIRELSTGADEWTIDEALVKTEIVLYLISASFLASNYRGNAEMAWALERHERGEAQVIPVILEPVDWASTELDGLQALPSKAKAVTTWSNRREAYLNITQGIRDAARAVLQDPRRGRPSDDAEASAEEIEQSRISPIPNAQVPPASPALEVEANSDYYVSWPFEPSLIAEIEKPGALIRIKSPKGMGKSSLTNRLLAHATSKGFRTVLLNLEGAQQKFFEDPEQFMQWFCEAVGNGLGLRIKKEEYWDDIFDANDNSRDYFERYLLKNDSPPLMLAIDNFDRLFTHEAIHSCIHRLLRSWHWLASSNRLWRQFRLVIAYGIQEPYPQKDINLLPFSVGLPVELGEFSIEQIRELIRRYGLTLNQEQEGKLIALVGGHPYLIRTALYQLANGLSFEDYLRTAATDAGVYSNHLLGLLKALEDQPDLGTALRKVMASETPVMLRTEEAFKLDSLGLVVWEENKVKPRCRLYQNYFLQRLTA